MYVPKKRPRLFFPEKEKTFFILNMIFWDSGVTVWDFCCMDLVFLKRGFQ